MDLTKYTPYFNNMQPGEKLSLAKSKDPSQLLKAGKLCIDMGYPLIFSDDYSEIRKTEKFIFPNKLSP